MTRRFGSTYQTTIMNNGLPVTDRNRVRLIKYEFGTTELYEIIIREDLAANVAFDIYLDGVFQVSVPAVAATYQAAMVRQIRWVKDYNRIILLHPSVPPYELRRVAANNWTLSQIVFQFFPTYDFTYEDAPGSLPTPNTPYWSNGVTLTPNAIAATTITASTAIFTSNHVGGLIVAATGGENTGIFRITAVNAGGTVATGYAVKDFTSTAAIKGNIS